MTDLILQPPPSSIKTFEIDIELVNNKKLFKNAKTYDNRLITLLPSIMPDILTVKDIYIIGQQIINLN